ncbi:PXA domain protein [Paramyrothecium foliicola]|nr:PXA domain protein [Paramyrothecium foliicola]
MRAGSAAQSSATTGHGSKSEPQQAAMTVVAGAATARAPTPPLPQSSSTTPSPSAAATAAAAAASTEARPPVAARRSNRPPPADPLSDRATSLLIRRTLCPQQLGDKARDAQAPIEELLPPLTSRNDVDLQLYAFLAIVLREFVQSWYGKITSDETFVAEVVHVIAHCTRALEQRCRKLDLESLLLDEIPDLLDRHISAYRVSHQPVSQPPVESHARDIYHALCPLPFLSPAPRPDEPATAAEQLENERAYRQLLVEAVLSILLPTEDLENPCLTAIVGQIFSELIIGNVIANKAAQPWLLLEAICITARVVGKKASVPEKTGSDSGLRRQEWSVQGFFVSIIHLGILVFTSIRFLVTTLVMSSSVPPRAAWTDEKGAQSLKPGSGSSMAAKVPVLTFKIWACAGNLIELPLRMPWLSGFLSLLQHGAVVGPGRMAGLNSPIDRRCPDLALAQTLGGSKWSLRECLASRPFGDRPIAARSATSGLRLLEWLPKPPPPIQHDGHFTRPTRPGSSAVGITGETRILARRPLADFDLCLLPSSLRLLPRHPARDLLEAASRLSVTSISKPPCSITSADNSIASHSIVAARDRTGLPGSTCDAQVIRSRVAALRMCRLLSHHIQASLSPSQLPPLLRTLRGVLFPNNAPGTSQLSPPSSEAELRALRRRAASTLWGLLPKGVGRFYFGGLLWQQGGDGEYHGEEALVDEVEGLLMILSDEYCNKHLMYSVLELLLVRLMPELSDKGVVELLDERLG